MKKLLPKKLNSLILGILIFVLIVQNPLPIAKLLYRIAPIAQAEEIVRYFEEEAVISSVDTVKKSVVEIIVYKGSKSNNLTIRQERGRATGIIVSSEGLILTNRHIAIKGNMFEVIAGDKTTFEAEVAVKSPINDLALLKIKASGLPYANLGNSDNLKQGQAVLSIGYAKGEFSKTVTRGVVSGLKRSFIAGDNGTLENLSDLIQTDAMLNEGSSGGPLFNIKGEIIGINTAVDESSRAINFALPINRAKPMIENYQKTGKYEPGWLGVYYVPVDKQVQDLLDLPYDYGAYITNDKNNKYPDGVLEDSPAKAAGLKKDDLILEVNGIQLNETNPLNEVMQKYQAGTTVLVRIYRNGVPGLLNVTLGKWPENLDPMNP